MGDKRRVIKCAQCGNEIAVGEPYYMVGDNTIQLTYFTDGAEYNCFCSKDCLCESLSVLEIENDGNVEFGEEVEGEDDA